MYCVLSIHELNRELYNSYEEALADAKDYAADDLCGDAYYVGEITLLSKVEPSNIIVKVTMI